MEEPKGETGSSKHDKWMIARNPGTPSRGNDVFASGPFSVEEIKAYIKAGKLNSSIELFNDAYPHGIAASAIIWLGPLINPNIVEFSKSRRGKATVLCGPNNSGKSYTLKAIGRTVGIDAYMLSCARFHNINNLQGQPQDGDVEKEQAFQSFLHQSSTFENSELHQIGLDQIIMRMKDGARSKLFELCGEILSARITLKKTDPENEFSARFVQLGGEPISVASSGTRLILTIFATCFDGRFSTILIDEPEIGLSPKSQVVVAKYLLDPGVRGNWFPHINQVFLATHSHFFLDRSDLSNNYSVQLTKDGIILSQVNSIAEFHNLQFNMLGNDLESLFLPSAVVLVEGPSDYYVLDRAFKQRYPLKRITVINARTVSEMAHQMKVIADVFNEIRKSPYRQRVFAALDSVITPGPRGTKEGLLAQGIEPTNIVQWKQNGIEHYYPTDIMAQIFHCGADAIKQMEISGDTVTVNDLSYKKVPLAKMVAEKLTERSRFGEEMESFFSRVSTAGD